MRILVLALFAQSGNSLTWLISILCNISHCSVWESSGLLGGHQLSPFYIALKPMESTLAEVSYVKELFDGKYFCFKTLREELNRIETDPEKLIYLLEARKLYLQAGSEVIEHKDSVTFPEKIDFELEFIKLRFEVQRDYSPEAYKTPGYQFRPIKINCNINQLGDFFFQLLEVKISSMPLMETTIINLARIICTCFVDKENRELSLDTVKTVLSKSHPEKRPKHADRIILK